MNYFDLHMHSYYSGDGQYTINELIEIAKRKKLTTVALSDHDTTIGVEEMIQVGKDNGIEVIPAIELSTIFHDMDVHLLGYGINIHHPYFEKLPTLLKERAYEQFLKRANKFKEVYGIEVDTSKIWEECQGRAPWFALCYEVFKNPKCKMIDDFKDYLPGGKRDNPAPVNFFWDKCQKGGKMYVPSTNPDLKTSIEEIIKAGGIPIIAHPFNGFFHREDLLQEVIDMGAMGLEAYSNYHTPEQNAYYEDYALKHNLLITCGSDFHGEKKPAIKMGEYGLKKDGKQYLMNLKRELQLKKAKMILCDIDGTLYNWTRILSDETVAVLNRLHKEGYKIGLSSGRPYEELIHYAKMWNFDFQFDAIIGLNGAEVWDLGSNINHEFYQLGTDTLHEICDLMEQFTCNPFMYWHQKLLCVKHDHMIDVSSKTSQRAVVVAKDISDLYAEPNAKIMFRMEEDEVAKVENYLEEHPCDKYAGFKTQSTLIEFMDPRISKGFGVKKLCELTGLTQDEIVSFGDTTNDNSMLEASGWGVCLLSGTDDTKAIADDITEYSCEDSGFAKYINKYLFKK